MKKAELNNPIWEKSIRPTFQIQSRASLLTLKSKSPLRNLLR